MLTLILLVVLGGGVGILTVSMAERKPATKDHRSRRAAGPVADPATAAPPDAVVAATRVAVAEPDIVPAPEPEPIRKRAAAPAPQPHRGSIPASQTAVEGRFADLVRPSIARRIFSLVGITVIVIFMGIGIAALFGAIVGGAAEIVGNAIG